MNTGLIVVLVIVGIISIIALWFILTYNGLTVAYSRVEEAFSHMDIYLKKRFDLIPNLVETTKGMAKHEEAIFTRVAEARSGVLNAKTVGEKVEAENNFSAAIRGLVATYENYPQITATAGFQELMGSLKEIEKEISSTREFYNGAVRIFNNKVLVFPTVLIANMFGFKKQPYFEVKDEKERENVTVSFE